MTVVVLGEALIDLVEAPDGCYIAHPGGSPANTAVALARLGTPVAFAGRLSRDAFGRRLRAHIESNGVGVGVGAAGRAPGAGERDPHRLGRTGPALGRRGHRRPAPPRARPQGH